MFERNAALLIRASRGPVLLITLGVLLVAHQATGLTFNQTFPVLIIVFGLMWLLERMVPRPIQVDSFPAPPPPVEPAFPFPPRPHGSDAFHIDREVYGVPRSAGPPPPSPPPPPAPPWPPAPPKPPEESLL